MNSSKPQSATSLPRAPRDDAARRTRRYLIMMGIRIACFVLLLLVRPYGWWTWVFAAGAVFLPYVAVVIANVAQGGQDARAQDPSRGIEAAPTDAPAPAERIDVIRIDESRRSHGEDDAR